MDKADIIIIDDDADMLDLYAVALPNWKAFSNGYDAIAYMTQHAEIRAVLLDLAMPIQGGLSIAEELRRNEKIYQQNGEIKMAIFSALPKTRAVEREMNNLKIEKYFQKPMDTMELAKTVREWLG